MPDYLEPLVMLEQLVLKEKMELLDQEENEENKVSVE